MIKHVPVPFRAEEATFQRPAFASFKMGKKVWHSPRESHDWRAPTELLGKGLSPGPH